MFQALPAKLRVYRVTGRAAEAEALAQQYLERWRKEPPSDPGIGWLWTDLAALVRERAERLAKHRGEMMAVEAERAGPQGPPSG